MSLKHEWSCDGCGLEISGKDDGERPAALWEVKVRIETKPKSAFDTFRVDDLCVHCMRKVQEQSNPQNFMRVGKVEAA